MVLFAQRCNLIKMRIERDCFPSNLAVPKKKKRPPGTRGRTKLLCVQGGWGKIVSKRYEKVVTMVSKRVPPGTGIIRKEKFRIAFAGQRKR